MLNLRILLAAAAFSAVGLAVAQSTAPATPPQKSTQSPLQDESYRIRAEDVISITTQDVPDATGEFLVRKDGYITVPLVGEIQVAGLTTKELTALLTEKLKKEIKTPQVTVNLKSSSIERIYIMGAIRNSGVLDYKPKWRLTEVIAASGGLAGAAERTKVLLFRAGSDHKEISMRRLLVDGDDSVNVDVMPGDVINFQTDVTLRIQVVGQVGKQGPVEVLEGQGVAEVLAAAGGGSQDARLSGARIVRNEKEIPVDLYASVIKGDPSRNVVVQDGDTLYVPSLINRVSVIGQVGKPGPIIIPDGRELTLTEAVSLAGGPARQAKIDSIAIVRMGADRKPVATKYDLKALLRADKGLVDPVLKDGDLVVIAQSGKGGFGDITSGMGILGFFGRFFPF